MHLIKSYPHMVDTIKATVIFCPNELYKAVKLSNSMSQIKPSFVGQLRT